MRSAMVKKEKNETAVTVAFRIPAEVRDFFQAQAEKERRKLGQLLRIVLEDYARDRLKKRQAA